MQREGTNAETKIASLHKLYSDGRSWIAAEAALAQAEVASDGKRLAVMLGLVAVVFGCVFTAVVLLSAFLVSLLAPYVSGLANAAGLLGLVLVIVAAVTAWRLWLLATKEFGVLLVVRRWWNFSAQTTEGDK
jgi:Putative Actinobacterial Holin-X, holin superfamily III